MAKILYNKNVAKPSEVTYDVFSSDDIKYGEIVLCNSINEPGIYIFTKGEHGETGIKKINDVESIVLKENIDPSLSGSVTSGDSLMEVISKLQNQINESVASADTATTKTNNIVIGVGLNDDGTYKAIAGDYVAEAEDIADAIAKLDAAITSVSGNTLAEAKAYADSKISEALDSLDAVEETENGEVFVKISEINGIISTEKKELSVAKDETGLQYDLKLGDYIFGTINIPQDQFLSGVTFIESATAQDVAEALNHGQIIEEGKPYLKFIWVLDGGVTSPTYVDVSSLIDIYDATQIKLSDTYTGTSFDIKSGTTLQDAVDKITTELVTLINTVIANKVESEGKTMIVTPTVSGTNIDVHIDNETIVKNDSVSKQGELSVKLNIDKQNFDSGNVKAKYTIKSKTGEYGVITDTRDIMVGPNQFLTVETEPVVDESGNRTDKTTIQPVLVTGDWNDINGMSVQNGNGLATAYEVKQYVKDGIDGDNIFVGNNYVDYIYGRIDFNQSGITYDNVHEAFVRTDNNMVRLDNTIGLDSDGVNVHLYPSGKTQNCLLIKDDRTIMDALVTLDTAIDDMDYTADTEENKVFTGITQTNGHVAVTSENLTSRKLAGYEVGPDNSGKVAATDTLGQALGKLQGQINGLDWTGSTTVNEVFTGITEADGKVSASTTNITNVKLAGYGATADTKVAASQTLGTALGNLQGQIDSMDYTANTSTDKVFTYIKEVDGKVSTSADTVGNRILSDYVIGSDAKLANTDSVKGAFGKLQAQINAMDASTVAEANSIVSDVTETDGKITATTKHIVDVKLSGYTEGSDADITSAMTLGQALGNLQKQINSMDKTASAVAGKFVRTVTEADGKVSETLGFIENTDITVCAATSSEIASLGTNVKEAYKLVNANGAAQLGEWIKIYKDQTLKSVVLSGDTSTTGQWLVFTYILADGSESVVPVDVSKFLVQAEFKSGVTADNSGIVHGVVDSNSESFLTVGANGFKLSGVQTAINNSTQGHKVFSTVKVGTTSLVADSSADTLTITTGNTAITLTPNADGDSFTIGHTDTSSQGNISAGSGDFIKSVSLDTYGHVTGMTSGSETTVSTSVSAAGSTASAVLTGVSTGGTHGHALTFTSSNKVYSASTADDAAKVAGKTVGNADGNVPLSNGTKNNNLNADMVDGYHIVVGSTGTTANTIYIL